MNKQISPKITTLTFGVLAISFLAAFYVVAWQEPGQAPPAGNVSTPLNVGPAGQSKEGGLILNTGGAANGLVVDKGNLCIGADCRSSWPTVAAIPSGMIAMFDTVCPSGWTRFAALDNRFPQGATTYGGIGGSATHSQTASCTAGNGNCTFISDPYMRCGEMTNGLSSLSGVPTVPNPTCTISNGSNLPPYLNVIWCKKN